MKKLAKAILGVLCWIVAGPLRLRYAIARRVLGDDRACAGVSQAVSRWPGVLGEYVRRAVLAGILGRVGPGVVIGFGTLLSKSDIELGAGVYLGQYCSLGRVRVGAETMIADHVCIPSGARQHGTDRLDIPMRQQEGEFQTIHIGEDCWIGSNAVILADVGDHCIVAAGAVVTRRVEDYAIVAGNPARAIGDRRDRNAEGSSGEAAS